MKKTEEQYYNNLPEEQEVTYVSGFYCPPTPSPTFTPPEGFYTCPACDGDGCDHAFEDEWVECSECEGKGYITEEQYKEWED